mgnify:CR=1 FL=1|jgi:hypothetical protein
MSDNSSHKLTRPPQLNFFKCLGQDQQDYSNTIELYDVLPKYYYGNAKRIEDKFLNEIEREFSFRDKKYTMTIRPTVITNSKGEEKAYYPTQREEIIEDAIRKIAIERGGVFIDGGAGVQFSLYELEQELRKRGHGYKSAQIKEAITVCHNTSIELSSEDGKDEISFHLFESIGFSSRDKKDKKAFVKFNSLVTKSINQKTFRLFNYKRCMSLKHMLSRWLFKRISHHFLQASATNPYSIKLTTIIRDSGVARYKKLADNRKQIIKSLEELKVRSVFTKYEEQIVYDHKRKNKIEDVKYSFWLSDEFCKDVKKANFIQKKISEQGDSNQGELLDFQGELALIMQEGIFKLSKKYITDFVKEVSDKIEFDDALLALKAAKETIEDYAKNNTKCTPAALTKTALNEKWCPRVSDEKESGEGPVEDHNLDDLSVEEQKVFTSITDKIKQSLGQDVYKSWFYKLHFHGNGGGVGELHFSFPTQFLKQYVEENYTEKLLKIANDIDPTIQAIFIEKR